MAAAVFGLVGVIVGALINGVATVYFQRRAEKSSRRSAARLVRNELVRFLAFSRAAAQRSPCELPQLREAKPVIWEAQRDVLARSLTDKQWQLVAYAYAHVDALISVLVFEADGQLIAWRQREAQRLFALMIGPIDKAIEALREADGVPAADAEGPDPADYLEPPVAV